MNTSAFNDILNSIIKFDYKIRKNIQKNYVILYDFCQKNPSFSQKLKPFFFVLLKIINNSESINTLTIQQKGKNKYPVPQFAEAISSLSKTISNLILNALVKVGQFKKIGVPSSIVDKITLRLYDSVNSNVVVSTDIEEVLPPPDDTPPPPPPPPKPIPPKP